MSRITQPPSTIVTTTGRNTEVTAKTAPQQQAAAQPQARAAAQDGFVAAQAPARMVLNPEMQARAAAPEVLPEGKQDSSTPLTDQQLNAAVDYAFNLQFNGKHPPSADERSKWVWRAREIAQKDGPDLLKEKLFSELNKSAKAGGTTPGAGTDHKAPVTDKQLNDAVDAAFKQQYNGTRTPSPELREQWKAEAKKIAEKDGTTEFLAEKVFSALNKAVSAGRTSPLSETDAKAPVTDQQLNDAVDAAFKQQYNGTRTPSPELRDQWKAEAKKIAEKDGSTEFLAEKVFAALNKAVSAGRTSPLPETDAKAPVTDQQLNDAVDAAFKQQYNGTRTPSPELRDQWKAEAKKIAEKDGSTEFLAEKVFSALNKAVSAGRTSPLPETDVKTPVTDQQLNDAVDYAFKQQYNGTRTPTPELRDQWKARAKELADKAGSTEFLKEKLFTELNRAVSAGQTSPIGTQDTKAPVTDKQLEDAVNAAFKQQFNGTHPPTQREMDAWKAEAKKIAENDGTTEFLAEKVFTALNKASKK